MKIFLLSFFLVGLAAAQTVKEHLLRRIDATERPIAYSKHHLTTRGLDYFAEMVSKVHTHLNETRLKVIAMPDNMTHEDAVPLLHNLTLYDIELNTNIKRVETLERAKANGLYLAAIKLAEKDTSAPLAEDIESQVYKIIEKENAMKNLTEYVPKKKADIVLTSLVQLLEVDLIHNGQALQSLDDHNAIKLEMDAKRRIMRYKMENKPEKAKELEEALKKFLDSTFKLFKLHPLDSKEKCNLFMPMVPAHWADYQALRSKLIVIHETIHMGL